MASSVEDNEIPVFLINGFLEGGKTTFINYTIGEEYFHIKENTLLIVTEEGEVSYDEKLLKKEHTHKVVVEDQEILTQDYLEQLSKETKAERVVIEWNGMWDPSKLLFPKEWKLYQQITIFSALTLDMYLANMKSLMGPMLRYTELVLINRCDNIPQEKLQGWKKQLRPMMLQQADIVFEAADGEVPVDVIPEDLPYAVDTDPIVIKPEHFATWFFDTRDYPERYLDKRVEFTACIMKSRNFEKGQFVPGRMAMTCCEADMRFIGYLAHFDGIDKYKNKDWVHLVARVIMKDCTEYQGEGPFLEVESMEKAEMIKEPAAL